MRRKLALLSSCACRSALPAALRISVQQMQQQHSWDCGLTCIQMLLSDAQRARFLKDFNAICSAAGFHRSTWTIDLCYLLRHFRVAHEFCTTAAGAADAHRTAAFYAPVFRRDEARVNCRFRHAAAMGISVRVRSVPLDGVLRRLRDGAAIVLTDATRLACAACRHGRRMARAASSFIGHYVVLCGYDMRTRLVFYRNPAVGDHLCAMPFHSFDDARKAIGTDEDIIFVKMAAQNASSP